MTAPPVSFACFLGQRRQPLKNVYIPAPSLVRVDRGCKQLLWRGQSVEISGHHWLAVPGNQHFTFVNQPDDSGFQSRVFSFNANPPVEWLTSVPEISRPPRIRASVALEFAFELLAQSLDSGLSPTAQFHLVQALFAELREIGALALLFPGAELSWCDRVARYLAANPGDDHTLDSVSRDLLLSRATLNRRLAAEGSSFRRILTDVRMGYGLGLLQQGYSVLETALACGYQSESRFAGRFRQQLGISPAQYRQTLVQDEIQVMVG